METMDNLCPIYGTVWMPYYYVDTMDKIPSDSKSDGKPSIVLMVISFPIPPLKGDILTWH